MAGFKLINGEWRIDKSLASKLDYGIKMAKWLLPGDSLSGDASAAWTSSPDLEIVSSKVEDDPKFGLIAYVLVRGGGPVGSVSWARCTWTTDQGRVEEQTMFFDMVQK